MTVIDPESIARELFFIMGTGRCGSTLLQAMLSSHPGLFVSPETKFFDVVDPARLAGDPLPSDESLDRYLDDCRDYWFWRDLELDESRLRRDAIAGGRSARAVFLSIMIQWLERGGKRRIGEKTPGHFKHMRRIRSLFPDARFIHIYRDPRDVVTSMLRMEWASHDSALQHAKTWRNAMRKDRRYAAEFGDAYTNIRYETLVERPEEELKRLCVFLGEDYDPAMLRFAQREHAGFGESEMAWKGDTLKPLSRASIGRYRSSLTPRQIRTVERVVGRWLVRMGYERDREVADRPHWIVGDALGWGHQWVVRQGQSVCKRLGIGGT